MSGHRLLCSALQLSLAQTLIRKTYVGQMTLTLSSHLIQHKPHDSGFLETSLRTSVSTSLLWKLRWQPQAAHVRAAAPLPSSPLGMNSRQPSTAYPPTLAAWFFWHSPYLIELTANDEFAELCEDCSLFTTTLCLFIS
nr:hypothetical protein Iba_chr05fCG4310 [Ipomoea batatas]